MALIDSIESLDDWQNKNAAEVHAELTATNIQHIDEQMYTWAGVALVAGPEGAEGLRLALEANGMGWAVHQLGGSGIQLSNDLVQGALLAFAAGGVPGAALLASTGKRMESIADRDGLGSVTVEQVQAVLGTLHLDALRQSKKQAALDRYSAYATAIDLWDGVSTEPVL
jgi:hypothetical protein